MEEFKLYNVALQQDLYQFLTTKIIDIFILENKETLLTEIHIKIDKDTLLIYKYIKYEYAVNDISILTTLKNYIK